MIALEAASHTPPAGLESLLRELGAGEAGFGGTTFGRGEATLAEFLADCVAGTDAANLSPGRVPQTIFWIIADGAAVGMLRMRHYLNDALRVEGGHIGYYVRPSARRRGVAREALRLALAELARLGEEKAMLTTYPDNAGSIRVIEANGGVLAAQVQDPGGERTISQYWIPLASEVS